MQPDDGTRGYLAGPPAPYGTLADLVPVPDAAAFPVQPGLDPGFAAALGVAGMAGWVAPDYRGHLRPGETVLILGAGGTAGQLAVQAARLLGAGRVVGAAREKDLRQVDAAAPTRSSTSPTTRPSTLAWPAQRPAATT